MASRPGDAMTEATVSSRVTVFANRPAKGGKGGKRGKRGKAGAVEARQRARSWSRAGAVGGLIAA